MGLSGTERDRAGPSDEGDKDGDTIHIYVKSGWRLLLRANSHTNIPGHLFSTQDLIRVL